ncbi:MAG: acylneuraminate cytidylyltransferase family protein [Gammaproteobacteria bacterium]|nr:acylneuraminate cytidylyltransferase family protein [Gammaproteobacteria bacterium]
MKTIALIPLRGGSKSIIDKNIKIISGKPLCAWTLLSASYSKMIDEVYVSTDSSKIKSVVEDLNLGVKIIDRPKELASDTASTESVMLHFLEQVEFDNLVTIQATSPLLTSDDLDQAIDAFFLNSYDSLLSVVRSKRFFWDDAGFPINYSPSQRPRRQDFKGTLMENGAFYITKNSLLSIERCRLGGTIGFYEMTEKAAIEIDELSDWKIVSELLYERELNN